MSTCISVATSSSARPGARPILVRPSPDERIDTMFGGLAAQLVFAGAGAGGDRAPVIAGYSCSPSISVATLELNVTR
jgi:hypothetical protein